MRLFTISSCASSQAVHLLFERRLDSSLVLFECVTFVLCLSAIVHV